MEEAAKLVECRQRRIGCIKELAGDWLFLGSNDARERLLRALLPFIEDMSGVPHITSAMARMIKEMGAPVLEELQLADNTGMNVSLLPLVEALNSHALPSLRSLESAEDGLNTACVDTLLGLLHQHHHHLLPPKLRSISLEAKAFKSVADEERFFQSLGKEEGVFLPSTVQKVSFSQRTTTIQHFALAISRCAFPGPDDLQLRGGFRDVGLAPLCEVLLTTLRETIEEVRVGLLQAEHREC